jgi:hypothetical protein
MPLPTVSNTHEEFTMNRLFKDLTVTDAVTLNLSNLESIPAGANPFHHDMFNMGTELARGWMAMHEGSTRPENPLPLNELILINRNTGQRFQIKMEPTQPVERNVVDYIKSMDRYTGCAQGFFKPVLKEENCIEWVQVTSAPGESIEALAAKVFIYMGTHFVRCSTFFEREAYAKELVEEYQDPIPEVVYHQRRQQTLNQMARLVA